MKSGNVIKSTAAHAHVSPSGARRAIVKRAVVEAREEASRILRATEEEAAALREEAAREARELQDATYRETREAALSEWTQLQLEACERRDRAYADAEADVLRLSLRVAEKIIGREVARDDATIADIIATALRNARQHEMLTIRINPADAPAVQEHRARLDATGRARFLDIVPDPRVSQNGCIIESESGTIDAELATQLRVLERALLARATATH